MRALLPDDTGPEPLAIYAGAERPAPSGRPWVMTNMVAGLDGAVTVDGRVGPLSSPTDQALFRLIRSLPDVILVGAGTVRAEGYGPARPTAERRADRQARGQTEAPAIAVVTGTMQLDWSTPFFTEARTRPLVVTARRADARARERAAEVADVLLAGDDRVDLADAMRQLHERGARLVLSEGGPTLNEGLVAAGTFDELCLTLAPFVGGDPGSIVAGTGVRLRELRLVSVLEDDGHLFLRYLLAGDG